MIEGAIDLRLGSPCDPPPDLVIDAMASAALQLLGGDRAAGGGSA